MKRCTRSAAGSGLEKSTNWSEPAGTVRMPTGELDPRPLLDVVLVAREVDPGHAAHAPLRIGHAAGVAVHDRVVGHARAERVVLGALLGCRVRALLGLVGPPAGLGARLARRRRRDLDRVAADASAARRLGQLLELIGRLVDRLQVALVLVLAAGRRDVRMPALGHPPAGELDRALVERRLELQQEEGLLDVEDARHDLQKLAARPSGGYTADARGPSGVGARPTTPRPSNPSEEDCNNLDSFVLD